MTKDKAGQITAVKLSTGVLHTYNVVLDKQGKGLAEKMDWKESAGEGTGAEGVRQDGAARQEYGPVPPKSTKKTPAAKPVKTTAPKSTTNAAPR